MNELAHWIMDVGTGALIGISIVSAVYLIVRLTEALPDDFRIPLITPLWNKMMTGIHGLLRR